MSRDYASQNFYSYFYGLEKLKYIIGKVENAENWGAIGTRDDISVISFRVSGETFLFGGLCFLLLFCNFFFSF